MAAKRSVKHPKPSAEILQGKGALTAEIAKEFLGWTEEPEGAKWTKEDYHLTDAKDKKVFLANNIANRPLYMSNVQALKQEILHKRWALNMEPRIIGRMGLILNGQHTFVALVLAAQEWRKDREAFPLWKQEPRIDTVICYGADESDEVVNTMDTARPRTLLDVIYRSNYFPDASRAERKSLSRMLSFAVRFLWDRTGVADAHSPFRTHSEAIDFLGKHPKLLECIQHIQIEHGSKKKFLGILPQLGYASGLLYLMGCSKSDPKGYRNDPCEDSLSWDRWDKAQTFWVELAGGALPSVRKVIAQIMDEDDGSWKSKVAVIVEAWTLWVEGLKVTAEDIHPQYETDDQGFRKLAHCPLVEGIDVGDDPEERQEQEEIEQRKEEERKKKESAEKTKEKKTAKKKAPKKKAAKATEAPKKKSAKKKKGLRHPLIGKVPWVAPEDSEPYQGKVVNVVDKTAHLEVLQGHQGAGSIRKIPITALLPKQPDHRA
jgi:hypothetical protein